MVGTPWPRRDRALDRLRLGPLALAYSSYVTGTAPVRNVQGLLDTAARFGKRSQYRHKPNDAMPHIPMARAAISTNPAQRSIRFFFDGAHNKKQKAGALRVLGFEFLAVLHCIPQRGAVIPP